MIKICKSIVLSKTSAAKIKTLVNLFDREVGWHGIVYHDKPDIYYISDILVHPQYTSATFTDTVQSEYNDWLLSFSEKQFMQIRYQGHSHVNMGVFVSADDHKHQHSIVEQFMQPDDYYIFSIHNKRNEQLFRLFESSSTNVYEEVAVSIVLSDKNDIPPLSSLETGQKFIDQALKLVRRQNEHK